MTSVASAKSKIVIVTHEFAPFRGGVATYSAELAAALQRAGQTVEVWAPDYGASGARKEAAFPVVRLRAGGSLGFWDMVQFARQLMARRAQLESTTVLLTSVGAHIAVMILLPLGRIKCRRILSLLHGSEVLRFERSMFWRFWARRFFPRVECVLTVSKFSKSLIERSFLSSLIQRIIIAPCAGSTVAMQSVPVVKPGDDKIRVLTLARVHPRKGQVDTAQALALLPPELRAKVIYQIGGKGDVEYLRRVEQTCRDAGVALDYFGEITATLAQTYQQCDIFAMTSRTLPKSVEGFGITYLEAGFHGKPVIGYRSGGAVEAVIDGETGILVEESDVAGLAKVLQQLVTDPALRQQLGEGGRRRATSFSWDATAKIIEEAVLKKPT
jgi:phosphatidylinositol alpha-1,6-mannosyltransferase